MPADLEALRRAVDKAVELGVIAPYGNDVAAYLTATATVRSILEAAASPGAAAAAAPIAREITFAHEVDGPWRLELNGVTISRHDTRAGLEQAIADLKRALRIPQQPSQQG